MKNKAINKKLTLFIFFVAIFFAMGCVSAADPPSANFTSNTTNGSAPLSVQFNDTSSGDATSWIWDFGDSEMSTVQNPTHTYTNEGTYNVSLKAINALGNTTLTKNNYITVAIPPTVTTSLTGGTYNTTQTVTLTSDDPTATIYYATDKTDPRTSSTRIHYTGPITISSSITLRYAALDVFGNWSPLYVQNYIIGNGVRNDGLADTAWPKSGGDVFNTGQSNYSGPEVNTTLWNYTTGGSISSYCPVIGSDGTIYIGSSDNKLYALNVDGTVKWTYTLIYILIGAHVKALSIGADGTIYATTSDSDNRLYALNPDGTLRWAYKTPGNNIGTPTVAADGTIYFGCTDGNLYALYNNGTVKWTYKAGPTVYCTGGGPVIGSDGTIYFESGEEYNNYGRLHALNPDGTLKWKYTIGGNLQGSPTISPDGTIYVGGIDGTFYAFNPDGNLKWTYKTGETAYNPAIYGAAIGYDGTIYFGTQGGNLYAVNIDGTQKWTYAVGGTLQGSPIIGADGTIYVGSSNGMMYAFNPDGTIIWTYTTGGGIYGSAAIGANGTLYFGSEDKNLYAIANTVCKANQTKGAAPLTVQFSASDISPASWYWDFGDGTNSTEQNPLHNYLNAGYYDVTLTLTRSNGQKRTVRFSCYIKAYDSPVSNFISTTAWGTIPGAVPAAYNNIQFNDTSAHVPTTWYWDFGDGTSSTLQNPTHAYTTPGSYTVVLTVTNPAGNNTFSYPIQVLGTISANCNLTGGTYNTTQTVTLTSNDSSATIYYAVDTTDPRTSSTRIKYTGPITISNTTTLRYAAVTPIGKWSPMYLQNYVIGTGGLADSPSPSFEVNNNNTGQSEYNGPQTNNTKWNNTGISSFQDTAVSIGLDGTIYSGSSNGYLYALYPNGIIKWIYYTGGSSEVTTPTIGKYGTIYIVGNQYLHALRTDGTLMWKFYLYGHTGFVAPAVGADGTIYVVNDDNSGFLDTALYALNPDGTIKWNTTIPSESSTSGNMVIGSDGTIYVPGAHFYAVNPDGTIKWAYTFIDHQFTSPSIGPDGTIYYLCYGGVSYSKKVAGLYAINADGTLKWTYLTKTAQYGTAAIGSDGTIYLANAGYLIAINPADGTQKWNYTTGGSSLSSPAIGADGTIYLTGKGLFAINSNGTLKWNYTSITPNGSPVIDSDGTLYMGTGKGLFAFRDVAAKFEYTIDSNPLFIGFNDTSNNATSWSWDFGDGTNSTLQNPKHTYNTSGQYLVSLKALTPDGVLEAARMVIIGDITSPTVTISPNGETFNTTENVILNATDNSGNLTLYYTLDGSNPKTSTTRSIYTHLIIINSTTTVKYAAVDSSGNWSPVYEETYLKSETVSGGTVYVQNASYYAGGSLNDQIQSILDNAAPGSTIEFLGQFYENLQLTINKRLNIISNVGTNISGSNPSAVFLINGIQASGTTISGFIIVNTSAGSGIIVNNTNNVTISNDQISSTSGTAVLVNGSSNTTIRTSSLHGSVTGVNVLDSGDTQIDKNNIYNNNDGIIIKNSTNTSANDNQITGNSKTGIFDNKSNNTTINGNTIKKNGNKTTNGGGISLETSKNSSIVNNQINENFYGLIANNITNATIKNNTFLNNERDGILLNGNITNTTIQSNTLQQNDNGININCGSENLTIRSNLITDSTRKISSQQLYHGSGIFIGANYKSSSTFLLEHNVIRNNANMDFRSCQAAGTYIPGSNWYGNGCKQVFYDPQMRMALLRTGENAFSVLFYDGNTGEIVKDLPSIMVTFINGATSQTVMTNNGIATAMFNNLANGDVIGISYNVVVSAAYSSAITPLKGSDTDGSDSGSDIGNGNSPGDGSGTGTGSGSGSGSGGSSGSGASSGSAAAVGATAASSAAGSSGSSGQNNGQTSKTAQELIVDDVTKNTNLWAIIGVILLLVLVLGAYYRKDIMNMIQKSKK
jgi:parallel beta-helix repeat protein